MTLRRARAERFGAILDLSEPPALVAIDRTLARRLSIEGGALWDEPDVGPDVDALTGPTEAHVAVTARCPVGCSGCYADAKRDGHEPTFAELEARLRQLHTLGVFRVAFGGGEPALRPDLPAIAALATELGIVPTLTTSGLGIDETRARELRGFAQINVSLDGLGSDYAAVRGVDAEHVALRAIRSLHAASIPFGINAVLTRQTFERIEALAREATSLGARELQLLRFKPTGRGRLAYLDVRLSRAQIDAFPSLLARLSQTITTRIDCSLVPFLSGVPPELLARFGVAGCEAGRSLLAVRADGAIAGCSFMEGSQPLSSSTWDADSQLVSLRDRARERPEPCASCAYRAVCRGGCRVVAHALTGNAHAPDPECPRVFAHSSP